MFREPNQPPPSSAFAPSDRLRIRTGLLARTQREDHGAARDAREPDELFDPLSPADLSGPIPGDPPRRPA